MRIDHRFTTPDGDVVAPRLLRRMAEGEPALGEVDVTDAEGVSEAEVAEEESKPNPIDCSPRM